MAQQNQAPVSMVVTISNYDVASNQLIAKHRIAFHAGVVYDFDEQNDASVTVFDTNRNRIVVLDRGMKTRATVDVDQLTQMATQLRLEAKTPEQKERYGIEAAVEKVANETYRIRFGGVEYSIETKAAPSESMALQFGRFADLASRLNMARGFGLPPFARIRLNQSIAADARIPLDMRLQIQRGNEITKYQSTHTVEMSLSERDQTKIDEVSGMVALYSETPLAAMH